MWDERLDEEILEHSLGFSHLETKQTSDMNTTGLQKYIMHRGVLGVFVFFVIICWCLYILHRQMAGGLPVRRERRGVCDTHANDFTENGVERLR